MYMCIFPAPITSSWLHMTCSQSALTVIDGLRLHVAHEHTHSTKPVADLTSQLTVCAVSHRRAADVPTRQRYVALVDSVKEGGGTVRIFSSLHVSGERE